MNRIVANGLQIVNYIDFHISLTVLVHVCGKVHL